MDKRESTIGSEVDDLFRLPLSEFTGARNALAVRLSKQGRREEAERVKSLLKPPISAWTVNQLYWRYRHELDALLGVGERFRQAQAAQLAGRSADVHGLLNERRQALATLMKRAAAILTDSGHSVSPDITRRITTTLDALATYGSSEQAPRIGRLTDDIDPPGFEALAALVPRGGDGTKGSEPTRVLQFRREGRTRRTKAKKSAEHQEALRAKAREALAAAEAALIEAQQAASRAEAALKTAAARAKTAQQEKEETEKRFEKAQAECQDAGREAHRVAREAEEAAQAVADAERDLEKARVALAEYP